MAIGCYRAITCHNYWLFWWIFQRLPPTSNGLGEFRLFEWTNILGNFKVHTQLTCLPAIEHSASYKRRAFLRLIVEAVHVPHVMATEENCHEKGMFHIVYMSTGFRILSMSASFQFIYPSLLHNLFMWTFPCEHDSTCFQCQHHSNSYIPICSQFVPMSKGFHVFLCHSN